MVTHGAIVMVALGAIVMVTHGAFVMVALGAI
jgi:hypothetical protein